LLRKLEFVIPELPEINDRLASTPEIHFVVYAERHAHTSRLEGPFSYG